MTDQAGAARLRACGPWVTALRRRMRPMPPVETLPAGRRFVVIDASTMQAPGATGTDHRRHRALDLRPLPCVEGLVSAVHTGATLKPGSLRAGDVAVAARGYAHAQRSAQTILGLSRWRWPGAIARKRWKSVRDVDAWRAKATRPLAAVWLHGTCLYALMLERRMRRQLGESWGRLDHERWGTWWRIRGMRKDQIAPMMTGAVFWPEDAWAPCLKVWAERPRRRP